jgi:hypothetical protein
MAEEDSGIACGKDDKESSCACGSSRGFDWFTMGLVLLVGLFAGALLFPKTEVSYASNATCPACQNVFSNQTGLSVIYLQPSDCTACNASRVGFIVTGAGVPFTAFTNDVVTAPQILMTYRNISTIARASNDFNVIATLCVGGNTMACDAKEKMSAQMQACLRESDIPLDVVVYYYSDWCGTLCNNMNPSLAKLEEAGYKVVRVKEGEASPAGACLTEFLNYAGGLPQFVCPRKVISYTGAMTYDSLTSFAEECKT